MCYYLDNTKRLQHYIESEEGRLVQLPTADDSFRRSCTFYETPKYSLYSLPHAVPPHHGHKHSVVQKVSGLWLVGDIVISVSTEKLRE